MKATFVCTKTTPSSFLIKDEKTATGLHVTSKNLDEGFEGTKLNKVLLTKSGYFFKKTSRGPVFVLLFLAIGDSSSICFWCKEVEIFDFATWKIASTKEAKIMPNLISFNSTMSSCEKGRTWQVALQLLRDTGRWQYSDVHGT